MSTVERDFEYGLLRTIHREVKQLYPGLDLRKAAVAIRQDHRQFFVQASIDGKHSSWQGRATSAAHAKYQFWHDHLRKIEEGETSGA